MNFFPAGGTHCQGLVGEPLENFEAAAARTAVLVKGHDEPTSSEAIITLAHEIGQNPDAA
jgi:hypothetical protein